MEIPDLPSPAPPALPPPPLGTPAKENEDGTYTVGFQVFQADEIEVNDDGTITIDGITYRVIDFVLSDVGEPLLFGLDPVEDSGLGAEASTNAWFNANLIATLFTLMLAFTAASSRDRLEYADVMVDMFGYMMAAAEDIADTIIEMAELRSQRLWFEVATSAITVAANCRSIYKSGGIKSQEDSFKLQAETTVISTGLAIPFKMAEALHTEPQLALQEAQKVILEQLLRINDQTMSTIGDAMGTNADIIQQFLQALLRWVEQQLHAHSLRAS